VSGDRLPASTIAGLRGLARPSGRAAADPLERCDVCGVPIPSDHRHLLQVSERRIVCACDACGGSEGYTPVGDRTLWLDDFDLPEVLWAAFQIPIGLAFFFRSSTTGQVVGLYPSPAGATECELHLQSWNALVLANPVLQTLRSDAEALIVNRLPAVPEYALAPIDDCYRLVGLIKASWEGISGGNAVRDAVPGFMGGLRARAAAA